MDPRPAVAGLKIPPDTPVPDHVPVLGLATNANGASVRQTLPGTFSWLKVGIGLTVRIAALELIGPQPPVTTTRKRYPFCAFIELPRLYVLFVAPGMLV